MIKSYQLCPNIRGFSAQKKSDILIFKKISLHELDLNDEFLLDLNDEKALVNEPGTTNVLPDMHDFTSSINQHPVKYYAVFQL